MFLQHLHESRVQGVDVRRFPETDHSVLEPLKNVLCTQYGLVVTKIEKTTNYTVILVLRNNTLNSKKNLRM